MNRLRSSFTAVSLVILGASSPTQGLAAEAIPAEAVQKSGEVGFVEGSGDLGEFLAEHLAKFSKRQTAAIPIPKIKAKWKYREDPDGFEIRTPDDCRAQLHMIFVFEFQASPDAPRTDPVARIASHNKCYTKGFAAAMRIHQEPVGDRKSFAQVIVKRIP